MKIPHMYRLQENSPLIKQRFWTQASQRDLHILIMRFARKESISRQRGKSSFLWRRRRKAAISVFERRFYPVPDFFKQYSMPLKWSIYTKKGCHVWPFATQQIA